MFEFEWDWIMCPHKVSYMRECVCVCVLCGTQTAGCCKLPCVLIDSTWHALRFCAECSLNFLAQRLPLKWVQPEVHINKQQKMESQGLFNVGMTDKSFIAISPWPPPMPLPKEYRDFTMFCSWCAVLNASCWGPNILHASLYSSSCIVMYRNSPVFCV